MGQNCGECNKKPKSGIPNPYQNLDYNNERQLTNNNQLNKPLLNKELNTNIKTDNENLETAQDEVNRGTPLEEESMKPSNIDRHASLGSSIRFDNSDDIDQDSVIKPNNDNNRLNTNNGSNNLYNEVNNRFNTNNGSSNLYNEINVNNNIPNNNRYKKNNYINHNSSDEIIPLKCIESFEAHQEKIVSLIELKNGKIATGSYDCTIKIWNLNNLECEKTINEGGYVLCLLEFEDNMLLSGTNECTIQLWDINSTYSQSIFTFQGHELWVSCLVKCSDKCFASCSNDSDIRIWDYYIRKCTNILKGHDDCVLTLTQLNDGRLCSGGADLTIKIWNWEMGTCEKTLTGHQKWVKCVCQLTNGYLVSGSDDKTIKIWKDDNVITELLEHSHSVRAICQISDNLFASASFDKTIKIWDINTMECVQTLKGHKSNVIGIIYHSNGSLISCSNDHYIKIWKK